MTSRVDNLLSSTYNTRHQAGKAAPVLHLCHHDVSYENVPCGMELQLFAALMRDLLVTDDCTPHTLTRSQTSSAFVRSVLRHSPVIWPHGESQEDSKSLTSRTSSLTHRRCRGRRVDILECVLLPHQLRVQCDEDITARIAGGWCDDTRTISRSTNQHANYRKLIWEVLAKANLRKGRPHTKGG